MIARIHGYMHDDTNTDLDHVEHLTPRRIRIIETTVSQRFPCFHILLVPFFFYHVWKRRHSYDSFHRQAMSYISRWFPIRTWVRMNPAFGVWTNISSFIDQIFGSKRPHIYRSSRREQRELKSLFLHDEQKSKTERSWSARETTYIAEPCIRSPPSPKNRG